MPTRLLNTPIVVRWPIGFAPSSVVGALVGNYLGIMGYISEGWFWFGNQGLSYIQLGRAWQIGFFAGLAIWSILVFRALWPTPTTLYQATRQFWSGRIRLEHLIWASTVNIHIGGDKLFVDYAGDTVPVIIDRLTGKTIVRERCAGFGL